MEAEREKPVRTAYLQPLAAVSFEDLAGLLERNKNTTQNLGVLVYLPADMPAFLFDSIDSGQPESVGIQVGAELAGLLNLSPLGSGSVELAIWLDNKFRGQGYGAEAVNNALVELFARGYRQVESKVAAANIASRRMLESVGFTRQASAGPGYLYAITQAQHLIRVIHNL